jgi:hypothetical protein
VLLLANSDEIENKLAQGDGRLAKMMKEKKPTTEIVDELYLSAFSRVPNEQERKRILGYIEKIDNKQQAIEDVLWTILNSKEFMFNH